tara:strand:+ start:68 stop:520 length:453 start_codon:yes stop_codon:yes gene_type:complete
MKLEDLKKQIPFKWRVQSAKDWGADCVAYIDARDVQNLLDEVCGQDGWSTMYTEHKNNLFCRIGITINGEKVWKEDCGTESNVEKQKGEASDAFKRAAVMWGVGRFLYDMPIIKLDVIKNSKGKNVAAFNGKALYGDKITDACNYKLKNK